MLRRLFCKHRWKETFCFVINTQFTCLKCGKSKCVDYYKVNMWRLRRKLKGESFVQEWSSARKKNT